MLNLSTLRIAAAGLVAGVLLAGCATGPAVQSEYNQAVDFGKYRTYGFLSQTGPDSTEFKSLALQEMQKVASREMEARGYTKSDTPDIVINFKGKIEEKADVESVPAPYYGPGWGYYGWYGAPYGGWGGQQVTTRRYNVGTLVMDIVDREQRQAVFQSSIEGVVTKEMQKNREAAIDSAVQQLFARYPFRAGQSAPVPLDVKK